MKSFVHSVREALFSIRRESRRLMPMALGIVWGMASVMVLLAIGSVGVMNVVLASLAARRFEIGLRKALGATPFVISLEFFAETVIVCLVSGALGFLLGLGSIVLIRMAPLPEGFSEPVLDMRVAAISFGLLAAVAVVTGVYPARRAAGLAPVAALESRD